MTRLPRAKHAITAAVAENATTQTTRQTTKLNPLPQPRRKKLLPKAKTKTPKRLPQAVEVMSEEDVAEAAEVAHVADAAEAEAQSDASTMTSTCSRANSPEIT